MPKQTINLLKYLQIKNKNKVDNILYYNEIKPNIKIKVS